MGGILETVQVLHEVKFLNGCILPNSHSIYAGADESKLRLYKNLKARLLEAYPKAKEIYEALDETGHSKIDKWLAENE